MAEYQHLFDFIVLNWIIMALLRRFNKFFNKFNDSLISIYITKFVYKEVENNLYNHLTLNYII